MKTKNQFRKDKMIEIERIWDRYKKLSATERLFMVIDELSIKALETGNYKELPSINELARIFDGIFLNPKTGQPSYIPAIRYINRLLSAIRKDKGHPLIRPYTELHFEILSNGLEVVRNYVNFLRGKKQVEFVNQRLEKMKIGLAQIQEENKELENTRKVNVAIENYRVELEIKNGTNGRRRKRKGDN